MISKTIGLALAALAFTVACGSGAAPVGDTEAVDTTSQAVIQNVVPNCSVSVENSSSATTGSSTRPFWGWMYETCPNTESGEDFETNTSTTVGTVEKKLKAAGCSNKTRIYRDGTAGHFCTANWYSADCPNNSTVQRIVTDYAATSYVWTLSAPVNCNVSFWWNNANRNLNTLNNLTTTGKIAVRWASNDGSAPSNAAGVTATRVVANDLERCAGGAADVNKTCKVKFSEYTSFDNQRRCQGSTLRYACL